MSGLDKYFGGYQTVQSQGVAVPQRLTLNVEGSAELVDDPVNSRTTLSVIGGEVPPQFVTGLSGYTPIASRQVLDIDGYASTGDGGQGQFYWNSAYAGTSSPMNVIPAGYTTGAWSRVWDYQEVNVQWFGAQPGVNTLANTALAQAALNFAGSKYTTYFPPVGTWQTAMPLQVTFTGQVVRGAHNDSSGVSVLSGPAKTLINPSGSFFGPAIMVAGTAYWFNPTYTTRAGFTYIRLSGGASIDQSSPFIALSEYPVCAFDGKSAFVFQCWYNGNSLTTATQYIIASSGSRTATSAGGASPITQAFTCGVNYSGAGSTNTAFFTLTTANGVMSCTGGSFSFSADTALAFSYDGTTARIFVNGVMVASTTTNGGAPIVQKPWESVNIGGPTFEGPFNAFSVYGCVDYELASMKLSPYIGAPFNSNSSYTPSTTELTADGGTGVLLSFNPATPPNPAYPANHFANFVIGETAVGGAVVPVYFDLQANMNQGIIGARIQDLNFSTPFGQGVLADGCPQFRLERCQFAGWKAFSLYNNCYTSHVEDIYIAMEPGNTGSPTYYSWQCGYLIKDACGIVDIRNVQQTGTAPTYNAAILNSGAFSMSKAYPIGHGAGIFYLYNSDGSITDCATGDEGSPLSQCAICVDGVSNLVVDGGIVQCVDPVGNNVPLFLGRRRRTDRVPYDLCRDRWQLWRTVLSCLFVYFAALSACYRERGPRIGRDCKSGNGRCGEPGPCNRGVGGLHATNARAFDDGAEP